MTSIPARILADPLLLEAYQLGATTMYTHIRTATIGAPIIYDQRITHAYRTAQETGAAI
jgi:hypothetical protein